MLDTSSFRTSTEQELHCPVYLSLPTSVKALPCVLQPYSCHNCVSAVVVSQEGNNSDYKQLPNSDLSTDVDKPIQIEGIW